MKRTVALLLALALALSCLSGCAASSGRTYDLSQPVTASQAPAGAERKVVIGAASDIESFNPYAQRYSERHSILSVVYQTLVYVKDSEFTNVMITDLEELDTYTYRLHLYPDIYDTAGNHFTASDVVFSMNLARETSYFPKLTAASSITALDECTVEICFDDTMYDGFIYVILTEVFMVTEAAWKASPDKMATTPVGTTGYVLDEYVEGSYIVYKKAPNGYWQTAREGEEGYVPYYDDTHVDVIRYDFITEAASRAIALESGNLDISNKISYLDKTFYDERTESMGIRTFETWGEQYTALYNCSPGEPCDNINMRLALSYCLDIGGVIDGAFYGQADESKAMNVPLHLDCDPKYASEDYDYYRYNPELAQAYLQKYFEETGRSAKDTTITILVMNLEELVKVAQIWQAYVLKLGINCEVLSLDGVTRKSVRNSRTGWSISIAKSAVNSSFNNVDKLTGEWNQETSKTLAGGWIVDNTLHELMVLAADPETHSMDTMSDFEDYLYEQCYARAVIVDRVYSASVSWIELVDGCYGYTCPCACIYDWAASGS